MTMLWVSKLYVGVWCSVVWVAPYFFPELIKASYSRDILQDNA